MNKHRVEPCEGAVLPGGMVAGEVRSALKPCPFCGGANMFQGLKLGGLYVVWCHGCNAEITDPHSMEAAIAAWNRRADDGVPLPEGPR